MTISSPGVGSGLDVNSIVTQLMTVEQQPLKLLQTKASTLQTQLSAYGTVKSVLSGFQTAAAALMNTDTWKAHTFSSNNTAAVTGSASTSALATSFSLDVNNLAQVQSVRSGSQATGSAIGADGRLDIQLGQWSGTNFSTGSGSAVSINVASTDTLTDIATKINGASAGITAVVVKSGATDQLLIRGNSTGDAAGFQIKTYDGSGTQITDGTTGVGKLAYDYNASATVPAFYGMQQTQAAQNASISIDGIAVSSATNTVSDAVPGVTLNLLAKTTTSTQITVGQNTDTIQSQISAFVDAYNKVNSTLATLTAYDPSTKTAGTLQGDSTAVGLQNVLRSMLGANGPAGTAFNRLSDMGLEMQRDGSLTINSTKLTAALSNTAGLNTFFTASNGSSAANGMAKRINDFIQAADGVSGNITNRSTALQSSITRNSNDQNAMNTRLAAMQAQYYAKFNALDTKMGTLSSLSSFVSQQITSWNNSSG
jgi:flagellar hook-associated protein 2